MKRTIVIAAIVAAALGALAIRVVIEGRSALADGDDSLARGNPAEAIRSFEDAARRYLPLAPHVDEAYSRLRALTASTKPGVPLAAWRAIRSAARATRSLWTPHAADLKAADAAIAKLSAQDPSAGRVFAVGPDVASFEERETWHRARLAVDPRPSIAACALAAFGIVAWLGGAVALVHRGIDPAGRWVRRPALASGLAIVLGLGCWAVGLYNA